MKTLKHIFVFIFLVGASMGAGLLILFLIALTGDIINMMNEQINAFFILFFIGISLTVLTTFLITSNNRI